MRFHWSSIVIVVCAMPPTSPAGEKADRPLTKAKVGDFAVCKMTRSFQGKDVEMIIKRTVTAKTEKELTVQSDITAGGRTVREEDQKIDLATPLDSPNAITNSFFKRKETWEKTGAGAERIKVSGKTYDCTCISGKGGDGPLTHFQIKVWFGKSVPFWGLLKWESKSTVINVLMEITESGSVK